MDYKNIQQKSLEELNSLLEELKITLGKARFDLANNILKDTSVINKTRKDIAKIITEIKIKNSSVAEVQPADNDLKNK